MAFQGLLEILSHLTTRQICLDFKIFESVNLAFVLWRFRLESAFKKGFSLITKNRQSDAQQLASEPASVNFLR